jgi:cytochrome c oxidase subunit I+III
MSPSRTVDVSQLPVYDVSYRSTLFSGQALLCAIEGSMFFILIAMYFYLRERVDVWPPPGVRVPGQALPTLALIPLFLSCAGSYWASEGAKQADRRAMIRGMALNLTLAAVFLAIRAWEWANFNFTWRSDDHGSIMWTIMFLHTYDGVADLIYTAVLLLIVWRRLDGPRQRIGVHVDGILWYFLVGMWVPMYIAIYWGPRLVGTPR